MVAGARRERPGVPDLAHWFLDDVAAGHTCDRAMVTEN
jgi:hypothetical protein